MFLYILSAFRFTNGQYLLIHTLRHNPYIHTFSITTLVTCLACVSVQLNRKLMMTEADLERTDKKADAADEYVNILSIF